MGQKHKKIMSYFWSNLEKSEKISNATIIAIIYNDILHIFI